MNDASFRMTAVEQIDRPFIGSTSARRGPISGGPLRQFKVGPGSVESSCGAGALGSVCLFPPLSFGGARISSP